MREIHHLKLSSIVNDNALHLLQKSIWKCGMDSTKVLERRRHVLIVRDVILHQIAWNAVWGKKVQYSVVGLVFKEHM